MCPPNSTNKCIFLLLALLSLGNAARTQVPGYLGKTTALDLSIDVSPALSVASDRDLPPYLFNLQVQLEFEKVLSRRYAVGIFTRPIIANVFYDNMGTEGKATIRGGTIGTSFRIYSFRRKGNIAPLGPYKKIEIMYANYWLTDTQRAYYADGRSWLGRYTDLGVGFTIGDRRMLSDVFAFHYGVRFATLLGMFRDEPNDQRVYFKNLATNRLQGQFFVNFHIGIGMLLL